jgi:integrase
MARKSYQHGWIEEHRGRFYIRYRLRTIDGWRTPRIPLPEGITLKEANGELHERMQSVNKRNNILGFPAGGTFREFVDGEWKSYNEIKGTKASTLYSYNSMLENHVLPEFGDRLLRRITVSDLTEFFTALRRKHLGSKYILNVYGLLSVIFDLAKDHDLLQTVPLRRKIHKPKYHGKKKPALSTMQLASLIMEAPAEYKALFWTVGALGLRLGELLGLRWRDIDLDREKIAIGSTVWRGIAQDSPKTEASEAELPLPPELAEVLKAHRTSVRFNSEDDFVFGRVDGTPADPDHLRRSVLYPLLKQIGIEPKPRMHGFHLFRHSVGSIVTMALSLKAAQEILRHASYQTTANVYAHLDDDVLRQAAGLVAGQLAGVMSSDKVQ